MLIFFPQILYTTKKNQAYESVYMLEYKTM